MENIQKQVICVADMRDKSVAYKVVCLLMMLKKISEEYIEYMPMMKKNQQAARKSA
ncbi:MAG: hypothetical protein ACLUZ6_04985 [Lachnospira eligens]